MGILDTVIEKVRGLPLEDQQKVLQFVEGLQPKPQHRIDPRGMFDHLGVDISLEDFQEARREAWANFPRDFPGEGESP